MKSDGAEGYPNPPVPPSLYDFSSIEVASAGPGKAVSLGSLRVPPSWPAPASKAEPPPPSQPAHVPTDRDGKPRGRAFQQALMASMSESRAAGEDADQDGDDERSEK